MNTAVTSVIAATVRANGDDLFMRINLAAEQLHVFKI